MIAVARTGLERYRFELVSEMLVAFDLDDLQKLRVCVHQGPIGYQVIDVNDVSIVTIWAPGLLLDLDLIALGRHDLVGREDFLGPDIGIIP